MEKFNSIQTRLIVAVIGLSAAIVGCFTLISFWQVNAGLKDSLIGKASVIISPFHELIARDLPEDNNNLPLFVRVQVAAKGVSLFPELVRVHADLQGLAFFEVDGKLSREEGATRQVSEAVLNSIASGEKIYERGDRENIVVSIPFLFSSKNLGSTVLFFSIEAIAEQERNIFVTAIIVLLIFLFFGVLGAIILARSIAGPIVNLADKIGQGDLYEIDFEMKRQDEVGVLSRRFTEMKESIHKQLEALNSEIVDRKQAEKALARSENDIRITLNSIGDAVIATDEGNIITRMNPSAEEITGWNLEESIGKRLSEVFMVNSEQSGVSEDYSAVDIVINGSTGNKENIYTLTARDNSRKLISVIDSSILNDKKQTVGIVYVFRDITEQIEHDQQLRQSEKLQAVGQLAGGVAHDINNMLTGVIGATELLEISLQDKEKEQKYIRIIKNATEQAAGLTGKLLAFSRKGKQLSTPVDLHLIVEDVVAILERTIDKRIIVKLDLQAGQSLVIGDPSQLQSGILNLCVNSRDAMPEGGNILVSTVNVEVNGDEQGIESSLGPGEYVKLSIEDTGVGIPHTLQHKIFEPFFTTKPMGEGTGLGLAAVYGMVKEHHGNINVHSEPDKGSVFHILLPVSDDDVSITVHGNENIIHGNGTILVVEDEQIIRATASLLLENLGYKVLLANNGEEAVEIYRQKKDLIDLIILDMVMPVMDGHEAFTKIIKINPSAKVVMSSGYAKNVNMSELAKSGLVGSITKPFTQRQISKLINDVLGGTGES